MRENRYEEIMEKAIYLISRKGYDGTSFQDIADAVHLHKSTLFYYFKSKDDLIVAIMERSIHGPITNLQQIIGSEDLTPEEKLRRALENHLSMIIAHADNVNIYLNEFSKLEKKNQAKYLTRRKMYQKDFETIVIEMQRVGYFEGLDTKIVTYAILGMANWVIKWFKNGGRYTIKEISNIFYELIVKKAPAEINCPAAISGVLEKP